MQLQNAIMDVQTKINHERKEREVDQQTLNTRISECNTDVSEIRRKRDTDLKALEVSTKELATMGDAEKQRIMFVYNLFIYFFKFALLPISEFVLDEISSKTLQNLPYYIYTKTQSCFSVFQFVLLYIFIE